MEEQIRTTLSMTTVEAVERAQIRDRHAPSYVQEECLVYMLREYHSRGNHESVSALSEALLRRLCAAHQRQVAGAWRRHGRRCL